MPVPKKIISIFTFDQTDITELNFSFSELVSTLDETETSSIEWAAKHGLIRNEVCCAVCGLPMRLYRKSTDKCKFVWKCEALCGGSISLLKNTIFEGAQLSIKEIVLLIYMWSNQSPQESIIKELKINKNTCVTWCKKLRDIVQDAVSEENSCLGGIDEQGRAIEVEIDESLFFKRKFNRGRLRRGTWVFGAIERNSGKCFFVPVERRNAATLCEIINERILPGSKIISDEWAAYRSLSNNSNYVFSTVNHSLNFVSPIDPSIHTQNIENVWSHLKRKLRLQFGTSEELLESYLFDFIWRKRVKFLGKTCFNEFLNIIFLD